MIHLVAALTLWDLWHPLTGNGYQFWSGAGSDIGEVAIIGGLITITRRLNCQAPRCFRFGRHMTADGHHRLCRVHHPDVPNHRPSLAEIHEQHAAAKTDD